MSERHRHHDYSRRDSRERHRRSASPRRRSRSRSREHASSSKVTRRVERSKSPRRHRDRSKSRERHRSRSRSRSRERRHKHRRRSRSRSSSRDSNRHRRKKEKKEKKKKEKKRKAAVEWGKFGVISEADMRDKDPEFRTWLVEERMVNPEASSDDQLKKLFKEYAEDYNTATLPHEKYYDIHAYQRRMAIIRAGESNLLEGLDTYDPNADVLAHTKGLKRTPIEQETFLSRDELEELRRVKLERDQIGKMKLLGMNINSKTGVRMDTSYE